MKAFVTGGTGFIGRQLIPKLIARGYDVYALARSPQSEAVAAALGATPVPGDVTNSASMREAMTGSNIVFHLAGWYKLGAPDWEQAEAINVGGTRKVLRLAYQLRVPRIVYVSSVAVFGDTHGELVDETFFQGGPFATEYARTKWLAHYKVAVPLIELGAPITIVMPGLVYGPGDTSTLAEMMRLFYRGFPAVPAPSTVVTYAHVDDVARGILLAAEKGRPGESYLLTGPAIPYGEMVDFWSHLTGKPVPPLRLPANLLRASGSVLEFAGQFTDLKQAFSTDGAAISGISYAARSDKAHEELGWQTRPLQTGMLETFEWIAATEAERKTTGDTADNRERILALLTLATAMGLFFVWLRNRRRS